MNRMPLAMMALALAACTKDKPAEVSTTAAQSQSTAASTAQRPAARGEPAVTWKGVGLSTPESVLYDDATDEYLVSNIEGDPLAADGKGFIARLSPDGKVATLKWIESKKNGVTLDAPKGLAFSGDELYVADIDKVRIFDRKSGAPKGEVKIPGATFVNDVATASDGRVLVSDSGLTSGKKGMTPSGSDAVYAIGKDRKLTTLAKGKELGGPNGLLPRPDKTWVVGFQSGELYSLDPSGKRGDVQTLPKGSLDGILALPSGDLLVSSWDAGAVYRGRPGGSFEVAIEGVKAPADIGWDEKRGRVLVPLFQSDEVRAYDVK